MGPRVPVQLPAITKVAGAGRSEGGGNHCGAALAPKFKIKLAPLLSSFLKWGQVSHFSHSDLVLSCS